MRSPPVSSLSLDFRPVPSGPRFGSGDQPGSAQARELRRVAIVPAFGERLDGGGDAIVAKDGRHRRHQDSFAVGAAAVVEKQGLLGGGAGQAIAEGSLEIGDERLIAAHDPVEEAKEQGAVAAWPDGRYHGHIVVGPMAAQFAGPEVDHAVGGIDELRVDVPLLDGRGEAPVGAGERMDGGDHLRHAGAPEPLRPAGFANEVEGPKRLFLAPASIPPFKPLPPCRDVAKIVAMLLGESFGDGVVGGFGNALRFWRGLGGGDVLFRLLPGLVVHIVRPIHRRPPARGGSCRRGPC